MKLFEIASEIEYILATCVDEETGEISDEAVKRLDEIEHERDKLCLELAAYLKGEEAEADAVAAQAKALSERAARHRKRAERLRGYIEQNVEPGQKLSDARSQISWRKSQAVEIGEPELVPLEYQRVKTEPDKAKIKDALKRGEEIPGAWLVNRNNLQVK